mmetsp:Transcript_10373/g.31233  ORF Transcript_10373/g.31233 Transcript_10373/m.31233 type:complete len:174 (-) Transcript_10373:28-549(-)
MLTEVGSLKVRLSVASVTAVVCAAGWLYNWMGLQTLRNRLSLSTTAVKLTVARLVGSRTTPAELQRTLDGVVNASISTLAHCGIKVAAAQVWAPTYEDEQTRAEVHGEILLLCRADANVDRAAHHLSSELLKFGVHALGGTTPVLTEAGEFASVTDVTAKMRNGTSSGILVDF